METFSLRDKRLAAVETIGIGEEAVKVLSRIEVYPISLDPHMRAINLASASK